MSGWTTHNGLAVSLPVNNIDTDQLIPARFMSRPRVEGYADLLLYDFRKTHDGEEDKNFVLNQHPQASILLSGSNFGSGSSREAAVYALVDAGIQVVIAKSFGDIFTANAINNGLLPARVDAASHQLLTSQIAPSGAIASVDLNSSSISVAEHRVSFELTDALRIKLINGWDDIDLTMEYAEQIATYRNRRMQDQPWSIPAKPSSPIQ